MVADTSFDKVTDKFEHIPSFLLHLRTSLHVGFVYIDIAIMKSLMPVATKWCIIIDDHVAQGCGHNEI